MLTERRSENTPDRGLNAMVPWSFNGVKMVPRPRGVDVSDIGDCFTAGQNRGCCSLGIRVQIGLVPR